MARRPRKSDATLGIPARSGKDRAAPRPEDTPPEAWEGGLFAQSRKNVILVYILLLASFLIGVSLLLAGALAFYNRRGSPAALETHYLYQIRTVVLSIVYSVAVLAIYVAGVGMYRAIEAPGGIAGVSLLTVLLAIGLSVWLVWRCVKGWRLAVERKPVADPLSLTV